VVKYPKGGEGEKMRVNLLQKQHGEIREMLTQLLELPENQLTKRAFDISKLIGRLSGILTIHLRSEDDYLYPELIKSENKVVQNIAKEFSTEMGDLAQRFMSFKSIYMMGKNIQANPKQFKKDIDTLARALFNRIDREEKELYTLIKSDS